MEKLTDELELSMRIITLKDLWNILIQHLAVILAVTVLATGAFVAFDKFTFVPEYESTATLYILRDDNTIGENRSSDDFSLALKVVKDCDHLLKSHSVLDEVIKQRGLKISYEDLRKKVTTSNPSETRILEVTVRHESPYTAKQIVDTICDVGTLKIEDAMGFQQVNLYEYGILEKEPCNETGITTYLVVAMITAVLAYSVFLLIFLLDDRIRTEEDIERYLGLSILGEIPNTSDAKGRKKGYGYGYGAYTSGRER